MESWVRGAGFLSTWTTSAILGLLAFQEGSRVANGQTETPAWLLRATALQRYLG